MRHRPFATSIRSAVAAMALGLPLVASATPMAVPYLGHLTFDTGAPVHGQITATVTIFSAELGGDLLWGPHTFHDVPVDAGLFTLVLGGGSSPDLAAALDSGAALWLSFEIDGALMTPRQRVLAVPYARRAERATDATQLGGLPASAYVLAADLPDALPSISGTAGALPVFTDASTLGDSLLSQSDGRVGVAVAAPAARLHVDGAVQLGADAAACDSTRAGAIRFQGGRFEGCDGANWNRLDNVNTATGGVVIEVEGHRVHTFTQSGTLTVTGVIAAEVLVVGGGGGGGWGNTNEGGGGGGAGGLCHKTSHVLAPGSYSVSVGAGGSAPASADSRGGNGGGSSFDGIVAVGGGGGGSCDTGGVLRTGAAGGSGGGGQGCGSDHAGGGTTQPSTSNGATCYGHAGGNGRWFSNAPGQGNGGGGGGAGGAGAHGQSRSSGTFGGAGAGRTYALSGSSITYAQGGNGGPGLSSASGAAASPASSGNGGVGGNVSGGAGASGVVLIRYPL